MRVVLHAVLRRLQVRSPRLLPVCPAVEVALEPSEPVLPLENEEALVVWSALLAHLVLHREEVELLLMLCVFPEHVIVCWVVDGEAPPLCTCVSCCHCVFHSEKEVGLVPVKKEDTPLKCRFCRTFFAPCIHFRHENCHNSVVRVRI